MLRYFRQLAAGAALPALLIGGASLADDESEPTAPTASDRAPKVDTEAVAEAQDQLETTLAQLSTSAQRAHQGKDSALAGCLDDKVAQARDLMRTATPELMVVRDPAATSAAKAFAAQKVQAAAARMGSVAEAAARCAGDAQPPNPDEAARNELDKTDQIPLADPTVAPTEPDVPPSVDQAQPPTVASPTL